MRGRVLTLLLLSRAAGCRSRNNAESRDSAAAPDTAAILGTGSAPLPTPAQVDSERARRDSVRPTKQP